jgi:hypothetical protein
MKNLKKTAAIALILFLTAGCSILNVFSKKKQPLPPEIGSDMNTPGFWTNANSNKVIMNEEEITRLNNSTLENPEFINNITKAPMLFSQQNLYNDLALSIKKISGQRLFLETGEKVPSDMLQEISNNMNINDLLFEGVCRYALVIKHTNLRHLPTQEAFYKNTENANTDELQVDTLETGMPLAIMHASLDGKWYYVLSRFSAGWVETDKAVLCEHAQMKEYCGKEPFIVITKAKGEFFEDIELNKYTCFAKMGARFPIQSHPYDDVYKVLVPSKNEDGELKFTSLCISKKDVHEGYLPYTPKNIIYQAFELVGAPTDPSDSASEFFQGIYASCGIVLPHTIDTISKFGKDISKFDPKTSETQKKIFISSKTVSGVSILISKNHLMLYLGTSEGGIFVVHQVSGFGEKNKKRKVFNMVNHTIVSDLTQPGTSGEIPPVSDIDQVRDIAQ